MHVTVRLTDDALFKCPYLHMEDVGTMALSDEEVRKLREYLLKGGFLWVDDYWGELRLGPVGGADRARAAAGGVPDRGPAARAPDLAVAVPAQGAAADSRHPVSGGASPYDTSERGEESRVPHFRGIADSSGRVFVVMTHNTDISDAWEREGEDPRYFYQFSPKGYGVGIDVMLYAMTH